MSKPEAFNCEGFVYIIQLINTIRYSNQFKKATHIGFTLTFKGPDPDGIMLRLECVLVIKNCALLALCINISN